ncbi:MAG: hypothetical protein ABEI98_09535 [Halorhabdus sp.]
MGLLDGLRSVLGLKAETDATRDADPEDLFGMSTAYVTMQADLGYVPAGEAALCFSGVDSTDFQDAMAEVREILAAGEVETGTTAEFVEDEHGYSWVILEDDDVEDLVTSVHFAADTLVEHGYGSRLLAAVFAFRDPSEDTGWDDSDRFVYWVYSFRRGTYYPFAPDPGERERDTTAEFKLQSVLDGELDLEDDEAYWYPLWPEDAGHPWE